MPAVLLDEYCPYKKGYVKKRIQMYTSGRTKFPGAKHCEEAWNCIYHDCYWWKKKNNQIPSREQEMLEKQAETHAKEQELADKTR